MFQESFEKLCTEVRPRVQKNKTRFRDQTLIFFSEPSLTVIAVVVKTLTYIFYFRKIFPSGLFNKAT